MRERYVLIASSVLFMTIAYLTTSVSIFSLRKNLKHSFGLPRKSLIPAPGAVFSVYMITQITIGQLVTGLILLIVGIPIYEILPKEGTH